MVAQTAGLRENGAERIDIQRRNLYVALDFKGALIMLRRKIAENGNRSCVVSTADALDFSQKVAAFNATPEGKKAQENSALITEKRLGESRRDLN